MLSIAALPCMLLVQLGKPLEHYHAHTLLHHRCKWLLCHIVLHNAIAVLMAFMLSCVCGGACCSQEPLVGTFRFASSKQSHSNNVHQGRCLAHMFVMRVAEELETWPEYPQRRRCWVSSTHSHRHTPCCSTACMRRQLHACSRGVNDQVLLRVLLTPSLSTC